MVRWQHQKGTDISHGWSIQAGQFPTWPPVSQIPPHHWWEVSPFCCKDGSSRRHRVWTGCKGTSKPPTRKASQVLTSKGGCWKLTPSSPDRGWSDSDGYSTVSEAPSGRCHRRRWQNEKCLVPSTFGHAIF